MPKNPISRLRNKNVVVPQGQIPTGIFKSAFLTAIKYNRVEKAIVAYNSAVEAVADTSRAKTAVYEALLEEERALNMLENSNRIHEMDARQWNDDYEDSIADAEINRMERELRLKKAREKYNKEMGIDSPAEDRPISQDEEELLEAVKTKMSPDRHRKVVEVWIKEEGLSESKAEMARAVCEELLKDMA